MKNIKKTYIYDNDLYYLEEIWITYIYIEYILEKVTGKYLFANKNDWLQTILIL